MASEGDILARGLRSGADAGRQRADPAARMVELVSRSGRDCSRRDERAAFAATEAIAVTGVTRTPVVLDELGNSLVGAITARDTRAQDIAARTAIDPEFCAEAAHYDAFHPAARLKWISQHDPAGARPSRPRWSIRRTSSRAQLTGRIASDPIAMARLVAAASSTDGPSLLSRLDLPEDLVPDLLPPAQRDRSRAHQPRRAVRRARRPARGDGLARHLVRRARPRRADAGPRLQRVGHDRDVRRADHAAGQGRPA